jgi:hypothetical protein
MGETLLGKERNTGTKLVKWLGAPAGLFEVHWTRTTVGGLMTWEVLSQNSPLLNLEDIWVNDLSFHLDLVNFYLGESCCGFIIRIFGSFIDSAPLSAITRSQVPNFDLPKSLISGHSHTPFSEDHDTVLLTLSINSVFLWFCGFYCCHWISRVFEKLINDDLLSASFSYPLSYKSLTW